MPKSTADFEFNMRPCHRAEYQMWKRSVRNWLRHARENREAGKHALAFRQMLIASSNRRYAFEYGVVWQLPTGSPFVGENVL